MKISFIIPDPAWEGILGAFANEGDAAENLRGAIQGWVQQHAANEVNKRLGSLKIAKTPDTAAIGQALLDAEAVCRHRVAWELVK